MQPMGQTGMTYLEIPMKDFDFAALGRRYQALPMTPRHWLVLLLSGSTLAAVAQTSAHTPAAPTAQAPQAQAETVVTQKEVQVTATRQTEGAYTPTTVTVGGKTPMTLRETPQSVTVLTQQRLEDQALTDTANALSWIPGLGNTLANESDTANITARGFNADNVTIDGSLAGASFWQLPADLSMYEQIEVLRGPAGLFQGRGNSGSPGGSINLQRKRPQAQPLLNLEWAAGQWDHYRATLDVGRPLSVDGRIRGRLITSALSQKDFIDYTGRKNQMLYGVVEADLGRATRLTLGADYDRRRSVPTYKYAMFRGDGSDPRWPRSTAWMVPWARWEGDTQGAFAELEHRFSDRWRLKAAYNQRREKLFWDWAWVTGLVDPIAGSSQRPLHVTGQRRDTDDRSRTLDVHLAGRFDWLGRTHDVIVGADASLRTVVTHQPKSGNYSYDWGRDTFFIDPDRINIADAPWRPSTLSGDPSTNRYAEHGLYGSLRLRLPQELALITGARLSTYEYKGSSNQTATNKGAYKKSNVLTPYVALTWDFSRTTSAYISRAEVFNVNNAYTMTGEMVPPVEGNNLEVGLKSEFLDGDVQASLAAYRLTRQNQTRVDPAAPDPCPASPLPNARCFIADNAQQVDGIEWEVAGQLTRNWHLMVGASHMKKRYTQWRDNLGGISSQQGQSWSNNVPNTTFKLWSSYRLPGKASAWRVGAGVRWQSDTYAERSASGAIPAVRVTQPSFAIWDAMVGWDINKTWSAQINATNLFDKVYYSQITTNYGSYGEPRKLMFTLRAKL